MPAIARIAAMNSASKPHPAEARRVLKPDGVLFAKIKDYIHNHNWVVA